MGAEENKIAKLYQAALSDPIQDPTKTATAST